MWSHCLSAQDGLDHITKMQGTVQGMLPILHNICHLLHQTLSGVCGAYIITVGTLAAYRSSSHAVLNGDAAARSGFVGSLVVKDVITVLITLPGASSYCDAPSSHHSDL